MSTVLLQIGPMPLGEHVFWFLVMSLFVFLVYNALRVESVAEAARTGLKRWVVFLIGTAVLGTISHLIAEAL